MNKEEIEKRIEVCEKCARDYREADNSRRADKLEEEKWKWEQLLSQLDPKREKELQGYKKGYNNLKDILDRISELIKKDKEILLYNRSILTASEVIDELDIFLSMLGVKNEIN